MLAYLRAQPDVLLFCPRQVEAAIAAATDEVQILERIRAIGLAPGETPQSIKSGPLDIDVAKPGFPDQPGQQTHAGASR
jgi:hypothetical protein